MREARDVCECVRVRACVCACVRACLRPGEASDDGDVVEGGCGLGGQQLRVMYPGCELL